MTNSTAALNALADAMRDMQSTAYAAGVARKAASAAYLNLDSTPEALEDASRAADEAAALAAHACTVAWRAFYEVGALTPGAPIPVPQV